MGQAFFSPAAVCRRPVWGRLTGMKWLWFFYVYSFGGFLLEAAYARLVRAKKLDRKCHLFLPVCPVYGVGAVLIALLPPAITGRPVLLFLAAGLAATGAEYGMALFYETAWHASFWNYSTLPGNVQGRVCLPFAVLWGALGVALVYWVHPAVAALTAGFPDVLLLPVTLLFLVDLALTGHVLRRAGTTDSLRWYLE